MSGPPAARRSNTPRKAAGAAKKAAGSPRASRSKKSEPAPSQRPTRKQAAKKAAAPPPAEPAAPLAGDLVEPPAKALERLLRTIVLTPSIAVTAANARAIAEVIPYAEPGDRPKMTRELSRLQAELIAAGVPSGEPPDWTQTTAGVES